MLGHRMGRVCGDPNDMYLPKRRLEVDVVVAGAAHGDEAYTALIEGIDHTFADRIIDERTDHIEAMGKGGGPFVERTRSR